MPEDYGELISLTLRTRMEFKETIKNARKKFGNSDGSCDALQDKQEE